MTDTIRGAKPSDKGKGNKGGDAGKGMRQELDRLNARVAALEKIVLPQPTPTPVGAEPQTMAEES